MVDMGLKIKEIILEDISDGEYIISIEKCSGNKTEVWIIERKDNIEVKETIPSGNTYKSTEYKIC